MKMRHPAAAIAAVLCIAAAASAADTWTPPKQKWSFSGPFGTFDRAALQRGFQVYRETCASCHGLQHLTFQDLSAAGGPGFDANAMDNILAAYRFPAEPDDQGQTTDDKGAPLTRQARLSDPIPSPFANEQAARFANNGALPQDLSLIIRARAGGADYVYALITGYSTKPPHGLKLQPGMSYNPYFPGSSIAMVPPLSDDAVTYADGTKATQAQEARDVTTFLAWASDPKLEERHRTGFSVLAFLIWFAGLMALTCRKVWLRTRE